jgi:hypothetical protein
MSITVAVEGSINEAQNSNNFTSFLNCHTQKSYDVRRSAAWKHTRAPGISDMRTRCW